MDHRARLRTLTPREVEVWHWLARGRRNKQIAHELGITERTVKAHRQNILKKLAVGSVVEAVILATRSRSRD